MTKRTPPNRRGRGGRGHVARGRGGRGQRARAGHDAARRDGIARGGRDRGLGQHRRPVRGGAPGRRRRDELPGRRPLPDDRPARTSCRGRTRPDVYFEWTGTRMAQRAADGYAADLTEAVTSGPLAGIVDDAVLPAASVDGKVVLMPHTADVTNVLWYNVPLLAEHGITPPTTWEELLAACDTLERGRDHRRSRRATRTCGPRATGSATSSRASSARRPTTRR